MKNMADKTVTIYLRSIIKDKRPCLALFDSNGKGDINNLETVVVPGSTIVWKLDQNPGIKSISVIRPRKDKYSQVFKGILTKKSSEEFELQLPNSVERALEAYVIEYILDDAKSTKVIIDPYIRIEPPLD